jgi:hypothetical protein
MTLTTALALLSGWGTACDIVNTVGRWAADNASTWGVVLVAAVASWATYGWQQRGRRRRIAAALAAETARRGPGWANNAAGGDGWPVDIEAQAALYAHLDAAEAIDDGLERMFTRLGPPTGFEPAPGSNPWLRELYPDAPEWEETR